MTIRFSHLPAHASALLCASLTLCTCIDGLAADVLQQLGIKKSPATTAAAGTVLSADQLTAGLKEALSKGIQHAVTNLSREGGFLGDAVVKIPLPESLRKVEQTLSTLRQGQLADDFITTMNRAAEQAAPEAAAVLGDAIKQMTLTDAKGILSSTNTAATEYFRRTSSTNLQIRFKPIVKMATERAGVTAAYKRMMDKASVGRFGSALLNKDALDLDDYVTRKALDGLFIKIAEQEKLIRENPVARTTDLLQKVFGSLKK